MSITQLLQFADLSSLILIKLVTSVLYLVVNYITHKVKLPVTPANMLRLLISSLDFIILLILISGYIFESCAMAYSFSILGILFFVFICFASWLTLVQNAEEVQSVLMINIFSLIVLLILHIQFFSMSLAYSKGLSALLIFNGIYMSCWLLYNPYAKTITNFMERVGEKLSWVDPLIDKIPHNDLALRNVCSFCLGLLNLTYLHTSGTTVTIFILFLIGLGLVLNVLIGLRLIKASASVKLHTSGFIGQIIINGYTNIVTIYDQLKNKRLPKAGWYAWAIALIMGLNFTSPSYCMASTDEGPVIDGSLSGEQPAEPTPSAGSPTGESREILRRLSQGLERFTQTSQQQASAAYEVVTSSESQRFTRDVVVGAASSTVVAGAGYVAGEMMGDAGANTAIEESGQVAKLQKAIEDKDATIATQQETINKLVTKIDKLEQKASWFGWLNCFKKQ